MSEEKSRRRTPYPAEMRERAVRMVLDHQGEYPSQWAAIGSVAEKLSINRETLTGITEFVGISGGPA